MGLGGHIYAPLTCELLCFLCRYSSKMPQIALISHQHDDDVGIRVVSQLLQPSSDVFVGLVLADIVHEESADSTSVVCRCDSTVSLLACSVPNLCLDGLRINLNRSGRELYTDG